MSGMFNFVIKLFMNEEIISLFEPINESRSLYTERSVYIYIYIYRIMVIGISAFLYT